MEKPMIIAELVIVASVTAIASTINTFATTSPANSLAETLADKFNLNEVENQTVISEHKAKGHSDRITTLSNRLAYLVSEGKLTQVQADAVNATRAELQKSHDIMQDQRLDVTMRDERQSATE